MEDEIVGLRIVEHTSLEEDEEEEEEEEEEDDDDDEGEVNESNMRWIVNKGLGLGKKVLFTGLVISSAPIVLPPLIVISALGFAFSVPFGIAFAGYTCTDKLMSKLLPRPESPPLLEYEETYRGDGEDEEQLGGKSSGFGGEMVMEEEERKEMEDTKEGVKMRSELVRDESGGYKDEGPKDCEIAGEGGQINVDEGGKEEGCEEDVGEFLDGENEGPMEKTNLENKLGREGESWEFGDDIKKTESLDLVATEVTTENENENDVTLTPGLSDKNFVEVGDTVKEDNHSLESSSGLAKCEDGKDTRGAEMVAKPLENKDTKLDNLVIEIQGTTTEIGTEVATETTETGTEAASEEKESIEVAKKPNIENTRAQVVEKPLESNDVVPGNLVRETQGTTAETGIEVALEQKERIEVTKKTNAENAGSVHVAEKSEDAVPDNLLRETRVTPTETASEVVLEEKDSIEVTKKPNVIKNSKKHQKKKKGNGKNDVALEGGGKLSEKQPEDNDVKMIKTVEDMRGEVTVKQDEKHLPAKRETKEGRDGVKQSGVTKEAKKGADTDNAVPGSRDTRHGRDVGQAAKLTNDHKVASNGRHVGKNTSGPLNGKDLVSRKEAQRKAPDVYGNLPSESKGTADRKRDVNERGLELVSRKAGLPKKQHTEVLFNEERMWERVNAIRTIVGYTAAPRPLLVDELKALYIFIGVEPTSSFSSPSDLAEVNDKTQFLMYIVGIKWTV